MGTCYPYSCSSLRTSLLLFLLLFLSFIAIDGLTVLNDTGYPGCPSFDCGNGVNVSYPFWVSQPSLNPSFYCGYKELEINCRNGTPTLEAASNYTVTALDGDIVTKTITLVDSDVVIIKTKKKTTTTNGCSLMPPRRNVTLHRDIPVLDYTNSVNLTVFLNCSSPRPEVVPCMDDASAGKSSYALVDTVVAPTHTELYSLCKGVVVVPVRRTAVEGRNVSEAFKAISGGFELRWELLRSTRECTECEGGYGLCGFSNGAGSASEFVCFCHDGSTAFPPQHCQRGSKPTLQRMILIGAAIALVVAACFFSCCFCIWRRGSYWTSKSSIAQTVETFLVTHGPLGLTRYRYSEVKQMTDSFNVKLGQGGYGSVFRGKLQNGAQVAVKLLNESKGNGEEFINEVASIGRTNHINVVSLLGFCSEGKKRALIYEFMPNGSLEKFLFSNDPNSTIHLQWEQLFKIALGIARGLEYLHNGCKTRIVHFDIKPHNILLDDDFCPKISDFGLAKLCPPKNSIISSICARGTIGYIAPEVFSRNFGVVSSKSDVYSYGMMVLEMVGGRKNVDLRVEHSSEVYFPHWIYEHLDQVGNLHICGITTESEHIARKMVLVGLWCIQTNPAIRPAINRVVEMLEERADNLQMPPKPFICSPVISETNSNMSSLAT